jgi:hypothetical protein
VSRNAWLRLFGIYTLVLFFANLFFTRIACISYATLEEMFQGEELVKEYFQTLEPSALFGIMFFLFALLFGASYLFMNMKDTRKRSAYLLWPVSNMEKYVIGLIDSILLMAVIAFCSYVLADTLRVLVDAATGRVVVWGLPLFKKIFLTPFTTAEKWEIGFSVLTWGFYFHSLYIVGATLFRRYQFLMTSIVIAAITILLVIVGIQAGLDHVDIHFMEYTYDEVKMGETTYRVAHLSGFTPSFYIVHCIGWLIIAFHYWASFKFFCRMQVINNKWLNI